MPSMFRCFSSSSKRLRSALAITRRHRSHKLVNDRQTGIANGISGVVNMDVFLDLPSEGQHLHASILFIVHPLANDFWILLKAQVNFPLADIRVRPDSQSSPQVTPPPLPRRKR